MNKIFPGWWQVGACIMLQAVSAATISSAFSVLAVPLGDAFDASRMVVMLAMTFVALGTGVLSPVLGTLMDRFSLKLLMLAGAAALVTGFVAVSFATSMVQVLAVYGLLLAPANVLLGPLAASVLLSRWFSQKRGAALGIAAVGISLGGFFFPPLVQALLDAFPWRQAFQWLGLIVLVLTAPAILFVVINHPSDRGLAPDGADSASQAGGRETAVAKLATATVLRDPIFWVIVAVMGVILIGNKGVLTNLAPLAMDVGVRADRAAMLISVFSAGSFAGKLVFAGLADRFDPRWVMAVGLVGFAAGLTCFWQAELGFPVLAGGALILGLSSGGIIPLKPYLLARTFGPSHVGRVAGLATFALLPLNLVAPPLFGLIYDLTGNYDLAMAIFIGLAAAVLLTVPKLRTRQPPTVAPAAAPRPVPD